MGLSVFPGNNEFLIGSTGADQRLYRHELISKNLGMEIVDGTFISGMLALRPGSISALLGGVEKWQHSVLTYW